MLNFQGVDPFCMSFAVGWISDESKCTTPKVAFEGHGDCKSPKWVMGPLPNGRTSWLINRGDPNLLDDSRNLTVRHLCFRLRLLLSC